MKLLLHDFLPNWMIFFHLSPTWLSDLYIFNKKLPFLLIAPSPSTALTFPLYSFTQNEGHEFLIRVIQTKLGQKFTPNSQLLPFIASFDTKNTNKQVSKSVKIFFAISFDKQ